MTPFLSRSPLYVACVITATLASSATVTSAGSPPLQSGWPQSIGQTVPFSPTGVALADLDQDGSDEVVVGSSNSLLYAWDGSGTLLSGFPVNVGGQIQSKAAVADLDGDGDQEILVAVKTGNLGIYHHDGTAFAGWPQTTGFTYGNLAPSVYDLDDDGTPEVLIGGGSNVRAWYADGTVYPGWPQTVSGSITGTLAIGDVAGDEAPEIFAISSSKELYGFQADGTALPGFPINVGLSSSWAAPSIGDLEGDGSREVLVVGYDFGVSTSINAYNGDGTSVAGFPVTHTSGQTFSCPVLADADGDGDLEIFNAGKISGGTSFFAWDHTGTVLTGWPVMTGPNMECSAIVADFDGAAGGEIAIGDNSGPGTIFGFNLDGSTATGFPISKPGIAFPNSPAVGDVDGDGDLELAMTTGDGSVSVWDFATSFDSDAVEWGTWFHDNWNTNQHGFVIPFNDPTSVDGLVSRLNSIVVRPNPTRGGRTSILLELDRNESLVLMAIYDSNGRRIRSLATDGGLEASWDGLDYRGVPVSSGTYFVRAQTTRRLHSHRLIVLR